MDTDAELTNSVNNADAPLTTNGDASEDSANNTSTEPAMTVVEIKEDANGDVENDTKPSTPGSGKVAWKGDDKSATDDVEIEASGGSGANDADTSGSECGSTLYFRDGIRMIDFIMVYKVKTENKDEELDKDDIEKMKESAEMREIFESNLIDEGLEIEHESKKNSELSFVKVHAPFDLLTRYAELMNLLKPMKEHDEEFDQDALDVTVRSNVSNDEMVMLENMDYGKFTRPASIKREVSGFFEGVGSVFDVDNKLCPNMDKRYSCTYSRDKEYLFDVPENREEFFTSGQRSYIVDYIMKRKSFSSDPNDDFAFGISKLIADGVYIAAYPLHSGKCDDENVSNSRWILYNQWVPLWKLFKRQPLDMIQDYFGVKIGLYFAWLGFYTYMLLPACLVGLTCFIYGALTMDSFVPTKEICDSDVLMCPMCDTYCSYWNLTQSCNQARVAYLVDNPSTIFFAIFMSIWAAVFLEMWKRYAAKITHRWDLNAFDDLEMPPRPEYLAKVAHIKKLKKKDGPQLVEYKMSFWKQKFPTVVFSTSVVLLSVSLAVAAVIGVIIYRMSVQVVISLHGGSSTLVTSNAKVITTATAATLNLICILIFNQVYYRVAEYITEFEMPRTQLEFDDSLTLKLFCLQFVNYYASIFYIAFFKGRFTGRPGNYNRLAGFRQEECGSGGCLMELTVQLAVIMIGKQAMNAVIEISIPRLRKFYNSWVLRKSCDDNGSARNRWEDDYKLAPWRPQGLFYEYLEMVLQFGFVTIFVSAFPLAPFFALLNNVLEIRLDAFKFVTTIRRSVSQRVKSIGIWYRILDSICKLSVLTNALIIAFTTNIIPRLVYRYYYSDEKSLKGFVNSSLSYFNTSDFEPQFKFNGHEDVTVCSYQDYRKPPWVEGKYDHTEMYWYILAARIAFVVIFENAVALIMTLIRWIIPDVPAKLKERIHREKHITQRIILEQELLRAKGFPIPSQSVSGISRISNYTPNVSDSGPVNV